MKAKETSSQSSSVESERFSNAVPSPSGVTDELEQIKGQIERALPLAEERAAALSLFAKVIEVCHDERPSGWYAQAKSGRIWVNAGRMTACNIARGVVAVSVLGPIGGEVLAELGANEGEAGEWKAIPGALYLQFSAAKAGTAQEHLAEPIRRFISLAMARMRTSLDDERHMAAVVACVAAQVATQLPQPELSSSDSATPAIDEEDLEAPPSPEPVERGRAPIFEKSQRTVVSLLSDIKQGRIALPDLQRPFVWEDSKVRDLLDSLFVGYPTGTVVLWQTDEPREARALGGQMKTTTASSLVIDGQQRLTSLYAVLHDVELQDRDGEVHRIKIAFRPRDGRFEVASAATAQDPEYFPDISVLWSGKQSNQQLRREFLARLRERGHVISQRYEDVVEHNLERLKAIESFEFPVIELRKNEATDEQVADIFVRINNQGTRLGQADFVLTLLSVYHGSLREKIERRASEMTTDSSTYVDTQQLLRAACAVAFERARMSAIYKFLRGIDPSSGDISEPARRSRLEKLNQAAEACIATTTWRDYLLRVSHAGFVSPALVTSPSAVMNAFAFYVKGQQAGLEKHRRDSLISRWLFATLLTARYSSSAETIFEADLVRVRGLGEVDGDKFELALDEILNEVFTDDYWRQTLVNSLSTQRSHAPSASAFRAAQIVLGARALFSDSSMQTMLTPGPSANRAAIERHHLFPKACLVRLGITNRAQVNQAANLADVGWNVNAEIGASAPSAYVPRLREKLKLDDEQWGRMCAEHALPIGWETLEYSSFLEERRRRMAEVIRAAFRKLGGERDAAPVSPPWFLPGADLVWRQITMTERALRKVVREIYSSRFGAQAAERIAAALSDKERDSLTRALRARPVGADPLTVLDYLYLAQLPTLLFANDVWAEAKVRMGNRNDTKQRLSTAISEIAPVRNEIAHVREVSPTRLQKVSVACHEVLELIGAKEGM